MRVTTGEGVWETGAGVQLVGVQLGFAAGGLGVPACMHAGFAAGGLGLRHHQPVACGAHVLLSAGGPPHH